MSRELALPIMIARAAEADPDRVLVCEVDGRDHSRAEFHTQALRWADAFSRIGVRRDDLIATMLPTSLSAYHCWIAASWCRAPEVPINTGYQGAMLAYTLNNSRAETLVIAGEFVGRLAAVAADLPHLRTVVVVDPVGDQPDLPWRVLTDAEFLSVATERARQIPEYHDTHAVIYTSGTTGPSKGVLQPWGCLQNFPDAIFPGHRPDDYDDGAIYTCWPTFHASGKYGLCIAVQQEMRMVLRPAFSMAGFWPDIDAHRVTHATLLVIGNRLLREPARDDDADHPLVRAGMYPLIPRYREFEKRFGVRLSAGFGNTEVGYATSTADPVNHRTVGRPTPGCRVRVVNELDEEVAPNVLGEIIVRHDLPWRLNKGYLAMPEATAEAWRNGWFHTGDAGTYDEDGNLYFVDRFKDCVRHRGHNVSSVEVENEVIAHDAVAECACVGVRSQHADPDDPVPDQDIKICVIRAAGADLTEGELSAFLTARLADFMVPRYIQFVDAFPRTPNGKIRKVELRQSSDGGSPVWDRLTAAGHGRG
ncbi:MAG TPA: AMP-binding protein [Pseudonocardia sp.]|jgi:crotonobetaine/carnitine-CoA ligase